MSYYLEWGGDRLEVCCCGQRLAQVPLAQATKVWTIAAELARDREWKMLAAFCAGATYGAGEVGVPDVVEAARERPRIAGARRDLSEELAEGRSHIRFPGRGT